MDAGEADTSPETPGSRLRAYIDDRWDRKRGGIRGLALRLATTPETMYEWFRDEREPSLHHLRGLADALAVKRFEIVAAMDDEGPVVRLDARLWQELEVRVEALLDARLGPRREDRGRGAA